MLHQHAQAAMRRLFMSVVAVAVVLAGSGVGWVAYHHGAPPAAVARARGPPTARIARPPQQSASVSSPRSEPGPLLHSRPAPPGGLQTTAIATGDVQTPEPSQRTVSVSRARQQIQLASPPPNRAQGARPQNENDVSQVAVTRDFRESAPQSGIGRRGDQQYPDQPAVKAQPQVQQQVPSASSTEAVRALAGRLWTERPAGAPIQAAKPNHDCPARPQTDGVAGGSGAACPAGCKLVAASFRCVEVGKTNVWLPRVDHAPGHAWTRRSMARSELRLDQRRGAQVKHVEAAWPFYPPYNQQSDDDWARIATMEKVHLVEQLGHNVGGRSTKFLVTFSNGVQGVMKVGIGRAAGVLHTAGTANSMSPRITAAVREACGWTVDATAHETGGHPTNTSTPGPGAHDPPIAGVVAGSDVSEQAAFILARLIGDYRVPPTRLLLLPPAAFQGVHAGLAACTGAKLVGGTVSPYLEGLDCGVSAPVGLQAAQTMVLEDTGSRARAVLAARAASGRSTTGTSETLLTPGAQTARVTAAEAVLHLSAYDALMGNWDRGRGNNWCSYPARPSSVSTPGRTVTWNRHQPVFMDFEKGLHSVPESEAKELQQLLAWSRANCVFDPRLLAMLRQMATSDGVGGVAGVLRTLLQGNALVDDASSGLSTAVAESFRRVGLHSLAVVPVLVGQLDWARMDDIAESMLQHAAECERVLRKARG